MDFKSKEIYAFRFVEMEWWMEMKHVTIQIKEGVAMIAKKSIETSLVLKEMKHLLQYANVFWILDWPIKFACQYAEMGLCHMEKPVMMETKADVI